MSIIESLLEKILPDPNARELKRLGKIVQKIEDLEPVMEKLGERDFAEKVARWREAVAKAELPSGGENPFLEEILPEALALAREAAKRSLGLRAFPVQLIGALTLFEGKIAEMKTGEGKTLVGFLAGFLRALEGKGVQIVTVNEYLALRDATEAAPFFQLLGMTVGVLRHGQQVPEKQAAYAADLTFGTNNELGFDFLRDNMALQPEDLCQRGQHFAIVDEVDSILIDEARTPLIISAPAEEPTSKYLEFARQVRGLEKGKHFELDEKARAVTFTEEGIAEMERRLGVENIFTEKGWEEVHHLENALKATALFQRDRDYLVQNGEVVIVDAFTGRLMPGRRFADGLHQALEAKEGVEIHRESRTLATITFQHLFRGYKYLAGMTGTAKTEEEEFAKIYRLAVLEIPPNRQLARVDLSDKIFATEEGKFRAVAKEIRERNERGQPVLAGTVSVEKSELLSEFLKREGIRHEVLNAKNHEREAEIIANAGKLGAVTIATNMAGRGTDIKLGGAERTEEDLAAVEKAGGLHILGTERHESRRIDNQLRGRAGRQGERGSSQFFVSLDDDLMRIFGGGRVQALMGKMDFPEDEPMESKLLSKALESAQKRVEGRNFDMRKHLFEFDSVTNKHRERIYAIRRELLEGGEEELEERAGEIAKIPLPSREGSASSPSTESSVPDSSSFQLPTPLIQAALLRPLDQLWMRHLDALASLRENTSLQAFGQRDPLLVFKKEAFELFKNLLAQIADAQEKSLRALQEAAERGELLPERRPAMRENTKEILAAGQELGVARELEDREAELVQRAEGTAIRVSADGEEEALTSAEEFRGVGRNDPCPCGSGKKFKKCCGR